MSVTVPLPPNPGVRDPNVAAPRLALSSSSTLWKFPQTLSRSGRCRCPSHSSSAAGHALRARSRREQGPDHQGSQGCPALGLSIRRPVFNPEVHRYLGVGRR
ncbi:hypothetical protein CapIbe_007794 [Capra ibex]